MSCGERNPAEEKTSEALEILKSENLIVGFRRSAKNGHLDSQGIDFLVFLEGNLVLPLQVKSSPKKLGYHYQKYPFIIAVVAKEKHDVADVRNVLRKIIKNVKANIGMFHLFIMRKTEAAP
ncbi:MAG: hypothetical protein HZA37_02290 [Parcubacteria group bacterium]|nr:hypothetical protein [Parcubacteria group bacterium]